jgi:hypothetical protein
MEELYDEQPTTRELINRVEGEINEYRASLVNTDWCVIKCQETGQKMEELYPDISSARTNARERINELEVRLAALYAQLEEELMNNEDE